MIGIIGIFIYNNGFIDSCRLGNKVRMVKYVRDGKAIAENKYIFHIYCKFRESVMKKSRINKCNENPRTK